MQWRQRMAFEKQCGLTFLLLSFCDFPDKILFIVVNSDVYRLQQTAVTPRTRLPKSFAMWEHESWNMFDDAAVVCGQSFTLCCI